MPDTHFAALRAAGLKHDDPDVVRMFDTSDPDWIAKAKAAKPGLFHFDALTASEADCNARLADITHAARLPLAPKAGFDALSATDCEFEDEMRRLGGRGPTYGAGPHRFLGRR